MSESRLVAQEAVQQDTCSAEIAQVDMIRRDKGKCYWCRLRSPLELRQCALLRPACWDGRHSHTAAARCAAAAACLPAHSEQQPGRQLALRLMSSDASSDMPALFWAAHRIQLQPAVAAYLHAKVSSVSTHTRHDAYYLKDCQVVDILLHHTSTGSKTAVQNC